MNEWAWLVNMSTDNIFGFFAGWAFVGQPQSHKAMDGEISWYLEAVECDSTRFYT